MKNIEPMPGYLLAEATGTGEDVPRGVFFAKVLTSGIASLEVGEMIVFGNTAGVRIDSHRVLLQYNEVAGRVADKENTP